MKHEKDYLLQEIISLIKIFLIKKITGKEFEKGYLILWKRMRDKNICWNDKIDSLLENLFLDIDAFVEPVLLNNIKKDKLYQKTGLLAFSINERKLRKRARSVLIKLGKIKNDETTLNPRK